MSSNAENFADSGMCSLGDSAVFGERREESKKSTTKGDGGVQFRSQSSIEDVMQVSRVSTYDVSEIVGYWGEADDHRLRRTELKKDVRDLALNKRSSDTDFTTLGIDDKFGPGRQIKSMNRTLSRNAVMEEQDLQYHEGILDDEMMRGVYAINTRVAKENAWKKAQQLHEALANDEK